MSFLGGPECSTSSNPLSQFQKHTQDDNTLQRDRLVNRPSGPAFAGFRTAAAPAGQDQSMNSFLAGAPLPPGLQQDMTPPAFYARAGGAPPPWAPEFNMAMASPRPGLETPAAMNNMPAQFGSDHVATSFRRDMNPGLSDTASSSSRSNTMPTGMAMNMNLMGSGAGFGVLRQPVHGPMYAPLPQQQQYQQIYQQQQQHFQQHYQQHQPVEGKGKGKLVELDEHKWEHEFAQLELADNDAREANAPEDELSQIDRAIETDTGGGDFEAIWKGIRAEAEANREIDLEPDASQWSEFPEVTGLDRFTDALVDDYMFEPDNLFESQPTAFDEGVRIMREGGSLSLAALAFEAAARQRPGHVEAWVCLGAAQAQNEKETAAIRAYEHALKLEPDNLAALMGLAVSYTNEGYESKAYRSLERWLASKYPHVLAPSRLHPGGDDVGFVDRQKLHDSVTQHFIRAAQLCPAGEQMDPDVQVGLGVLFYGAEEYAKAVDCFRAALESSSLGTSNQRDQVHLLWNRLGATLANSGRPEEAVAAYEHALTMRPNFVRARYNLGVSCINISCHREAAEHLLAALDMHREIGRTGRAKAYEILSGGGRAAAAAAAVRDPALDAQIDRTITQNASTTLYDTLRRVFSLMGRRDLAEKTVAGVDPDLFRPEFQF